MMTEALDLPDVNVLVALVHPGHTHHEQAVEWLRGTTGFATTPITESGLLRLAMNPRITGTQLTGSVALRSLSSIRRHPDWQFLRDDSSLLEPNVDLVGLVGHRQVTDVHLVNLAARHGAVLVTFDRGIGVTLSARDQRHLRVL